MEGRREARERALELLYEAEVKQIPITEVLASLPLAPDPYAVALASGVDAHRGRIDELIETCARGWTIERMASVDRSVLRIATYELLERPDVPVAVVISEAVELAKQFSTEESGRFVNGVLSAIAPAARADA